MKTYKTEFDLPLIFESFANHVANTRWEIINDKEKSDGELLDDALEELDFIKHNMNTLQLALTTAAEKVN